MRGRAARDVLAGDRAVDIFLAAVAEFDAAFVDEMTSGLDFTLRLEVRGCAGELIHCRVSRDRFSRPDGRMSRD